MKTKRHIIGLIGEKGSGKDTFADYYINRFQTITTHEKTTNRYVTLSFAEPLKQICQILYPQSTANDPIAAHLYRLAPPMWFSVLGSRE